VHPHLSTAELESGLDEVRRSPADCGTVELIVCRPATDERIVLTEATLDLSCGLVGDNWLERGNARTPDKSADPDAQLTVMNGRAARLVAGNPDRRKLAGDQLFLDLDIGVANLPAGTRLEIGTAVIEVSPKPHLGCPKFSARFGREALQFVNSPLGRQLRLRGLNARIVVPGTIRTGDTVSKLPVTDSVAAG
jgi:hypothetical protein